jgi:hypothetical protein
MTKSLTCFLTVNYGHNTAPYCDDSSRETRGDWEKSTQVLLKSLKEPWPKAQLGQFGHGFVERLRIDVVLLLLLSKKYMKFEYTVVRIG